MSKLFIVVGKSAVGKDTLTANLLSRIENLSPVVPYTTRPMRPGEVDGQTYHFVDDIFFRENLDAGNILEYREFETAHGVWRYFELINQFDADKDYILVQSWTGLVNILSSKCDLEIYPLYIYADEYTRILRSINRTRDNGQNDYIECCQRFLRDEAEVNDSEAISKVKASFCNIDLEQTLSDMEVYIRSVL